MEHTGILPYHNRHISFKLISGEENSGVIIDTLNSDEKLVQTWYSFVPSVNLEKWKDAEKLNDVQAMKKYERIIDIQRIVGIKQIA